MRNTIHAWVYLLAAASILISYGTAAEPSTPNPDPTNIHSADGGRTIHLTPRNDADDYTNLQWAVDNVAAGGTIELGEGTFELGDGNANPRRTVILRKGMRIAGQKDGDTWKSVIRGGGEVMVPGLGSALESGPFRVMNKDDDNPVVFENIWLREWACEVVFIEACHGFVFRGNRISHPANTVDGRIKFVHAIWSSGVDARGDFTLENNLVEMGGYEGALADDEQLCGVFYSNHDNVRVVNNVITGIDEAIELIGNRYGNSGRGDSAAASTPSEIVVTGNRINITSTPGRVWPSSWAILVAGNLNVDKVIIADNDITTRGKGWGIGLSGDNMQITGNTIRFEEHNGAYPPGAIDIGYGKLAGRDMGSSLNNSVFANNTFEGKVSGSGIRFNDRGGDAPSDSHGNRFDLGDSLAKLGAETTLALTKDLHDNTFTGDVGNVVDESPRGANTY